MVDIKKLKEGDKLIFTGLFCSKFKHILKVYKVGHSLILAFDERGHEAPYNASTLSNYTKVEK